MPEGAADTDTSDDEAELGHRSAPAAARREKVLQQRFRVRVRKLVDKVAETGAIPAGSSLGDGVGAVSNLDPVPSVRP